MSRRSIFLVIVAAAIAFSVGRYAFVRAPAPPPGATANTRQDEAAKAASRAMTFTQPKDPPQ